MLQPPICCPLSQTSQGLGMMELHVDISIRELSFLLCLEVQHLQTLVSILKLTLYLQRRFSNLPKKSTSENKHMLVSELIPVSWKVPICKSSGIPSCSRKVTDIMSAQQLQMPLTPQHKQNHRHLCCMRVSNCSQDTMDHLCWRKQD